MNTQTLINALLDHEENEPPCDSPRWPSWWVDRNQLLEWIGRRHDGPELLGQAYDKRRRMQSDATATRENSDGAA